MGADLFIVVYGIRQIVDPDDEAAVEALESKTDPRYKAARTNKLKLWWGSAGEPEPYHVLIGEIIGKFGWQNEGHAALGSEEFQTLAKDIEARLVSAGFTEKPQLHFQFEGDQ